jgi:hypothetical protein
MRRLEVLALCLGAHSLAAQTRLAKPTIDTINHHIVRVMNSGPTAWTDTNGWKLVYERTVQPKDGAPGELGEPHSALLLADGRLIIADEKPLTINLYDRQGGFVRALGREGSGPGEYRSPAIALTHDTLVMHDPQLSRGSILTLDGKVVRSFPTVCCQFGLPVFVDTRGRLRVGANGPAGQRYQWVYFDLTGHRVDSIIPPEAIKPRTWVQRIAGGSTTFYVPLAGQNAYAFLRNGTIAYGATDSYMLLLTNHGNDTVRIFGRTGVVGAPVSDAVRDSLFRQIVDHNERARAVASLGDIPHSYPIWAGVFEDGGGNFWIDRPGRGNTLRQFDVFRPDGAFLGTVPSPFRRGTTLSWTADRVAVLDTDDNDAPRIRIYRIDRRGH